MARASFLAGAFDQNSTHGLGRSAKEMATTVPMRLTWADEPEPSFMDEGCGLEGLAWGLVGHPGGSEFAEFVIYQRQQFPRRLRIALLHSIEDVRDVAHDRELIMRVTTQVGNYCQGQALGLPGQAHGCMSPRRAGLWRTRRRREGNDWNYLFSR